MLPVVNTHVHVPPNFSAFATPADVVAAAAREGVRAVGFSNFFDLEVYPLIGGLARDQGILPLYGLEFITVAQDLEARGVLVNDPANPGRLYLTGKGIDPTRPRSARAARIAAQIRVDNDRRAEQMVARVAAHFAGAGFATGLVAADVVAAVAGRAGVPAAWVSLQERHIARAFQEALFTLDPAERARVLAAAYGRPSGVAPDDIVGLQAELRSRLLKAGTPGFVPDPRLSFEDAYAYIVDMGGIPCYPIVADGIDPLSPFETPPAALAEELLRRGIHATELIPNRNRGAVADEFVRELRAAGLIVMGGTEHNTLDPIPLDPSYADGELSEPTRQAFYEATCVVAAHADRVGQGEAGFVDATGAPTGGVTALIAAGDRLIRQSPNGN